MGKTVRTRRMGTKRQIEMMKEKYGDAVAVPHTISGKRAPVIYKPEHNRMVFWLALAGMTEFQIASVLGVSDHTIALWKRTRPDFMAAMRAGQKEAVATAAHSLFKVGNGFYNEEERIIPNRVKEYDPDTGRVVREFTEVLRVPVQKYYPPNVQALLKFLSAKYPEVWNEKTEIRGNFNYNHTHSVDASKLPKKKLKKLQEMAKVLAQENAEEARTQTVLELQKPTSTRKKTKKK